MHFILILLALFWRPCLFTFFGTWYVGKLETNRNARFLDIAARALGIACIVLLLWAHFVLTVIFLVVGCFLLTWAGLWGARKKAQEDYWRLKGCQ